MRTRALFPLAAAAVLAAGDRAAAQTAYTTDGASLFRFDLSTPGTVTRVGGFAGATARVDGLDFRPSNGLLYGYDQASNAVVTIDPNTAATAPVLTPSTASATPALGVDFNPTGPVALRLVNVNDQNLRINITAGTTAADTPLAYAAGDSGAGVDPNVVEAAYTNNRPGAATTRLFYLDSGRDVLATTTDPNGGQLTTVGTGLGVNTSALAGFDIFTDAAGTDTAYAILTVGGQPGLYRIDLGTGAASALGNVARPNLIGLAVVPVPEPGAVLAVAAAGAAAAGAGRRRRARRAAA